MAALVVGVRMLQPERLAHPSGLMGFAGFLANFGATGSPYLPTTWAAEALIPLLGARPGEPLFYLGMLASTAAMLFVMSASVVERVFLVAWSRAQTGRVRAGSAERPLSLGSNRSSATATAHRGILLQTLIFLRDRAGSRILLCARCSPLHLQLPPFRRLRLAWRSPWLEWRHHDPALDFARRHCRRFVSLCDPRGRALWILRPTVPQPLW